MQLRKALCVALLVGAALAIPSTAKSAVAFMQYFAVLDAGNEADGGKAGATGVAMIMLAPQAGKLCFAILVRDLDMPTAAHIHDGPAGVSAGIFVTLTAPNTGNPGSSAGCVTTTAANITAIKNNPTKFYVNVHSTSKPNGAIRGQLF